MPVEMVTRRIKEDGDERGMLVYGYKFRPLMNHKHANAENLSLINKRAILGNTKDRSFFVPSIFPVFVILNPARGDYEVFL